MLKVEVKTRTDISIAQTEFSCCSECRSMIHFFSKVATANESLQNLSETSHKYLDLSECSKLTKHTSLEAKELTSLTTWKISKKTPFLVSVLVSSRLSPLLSAPRQDLRDVHEGREALIASRAFAPGTKQSVDLPGLQKWKGAKKKMMNEKKASVLSFPNMFKASLGHFKDTSQGPFVFGFCRLFVDVQTGTRKWLLVALDDSHTSLCFYAKLHASISLCSDRFSRPSDLSRFFRSEKRTLKQKKQRKPRRSLGGTDKATVFTFSTWQALWRPLMQVAMGAPGTRVSLRSLVPAMSTTFRGGKG